MRRLGGVVLAVLVAAATHAADATAAPFAWRGIVEGAYGPPWDHSARERVLRWMPAHGFNAYVHAPKDDLWQRTHWRDPYPAARQSELDAEIRLARSLGVEWIPNLSPALPLVPTAAAPQGGPSRPLCFSCPDDLGAVLAKLEPFRAAGARTFMISFDDVVKALADPRDVAAYGGQGDEAFGRANGDFLTRLDAALRAREPGARLLTVGADYSGTADTDYLRGLRATLAPGIEVMWTGTSIPAQDFTPEDARAYGRLIGRRPLVWDNWTNDDTSGNATPFGTARIFLGPYRRRADVAPELGGFFLNPMNEADLNLLPLATAGDWMADPVRYDARASWLRAAYGLAGRGAARRALRRTLRAWAETSYSTKLDPTEAPVFVRRAEAFLRWYGEQPRWPEIHAALVGELRLVEAAPERLAELENRAFAEQARRFLAAARVAAGAGRVGAELLAAERPSLRVARTRAGFAGAVEPPDPRRADELRAAFETGVRTTRTTLPFAYGWRGGVAFDVPPSTAPRNVMDEFFDRVTALDDAWRPRAEQAAGGVTLTLDGAPVAVGADGAFTLPRRACGRLLVATDGADGRTGARLPPCRRRGRPGGRCRRASCRRTGSVTAACSACRRTRRPGPSTCAICRPRP